MARPVISGGSRSKKPSAGQQRAIREIEKAKARKQLTTLKGIAGIIGNSVIEGVGGPKARAAKGAVRLGMRAASQTVNKSARGGRVLTRATSPTRNVRNPVPNRKRPLPQKMKKTTTGQGRKKVSDKVARAMAVESAGKRAKAPFGKLPYVSKPNSGSGLSKSEKARDLYYKSKQNPVTVKQGKPKPKDRRTPAQIKAEKDFLRRKEIRKAISGKPGKRPGLPKHKTNITIAKPKRTMSQILDPLKGKYVVTGTTGVGEPIKMDARQYVLTRARFKSAGENPKNSVAPRTRAQEKTRSDKMERRIADEERKQYIMARLERIRDIERAKTNPRRYSSPAQEPGNIRQVEGLIALGEKRFQEETARIAAQRAKIARTPRAQKQVEATLEKMKQRDAARRGRQRVSDTDASRRLKVRPNRARRDK